MLNHFKSALRSIRKHKSYSIINITGLTVGLCACLLVATVVIDDLSYDRDWKRGDQIYRAISVTKKGEGLEDKFTSVFLGLAPELKKNFPEVASYSRFTRAPLRLKVDPEDADGVVITIIKTDSAAWEILDFVPTAGRPQIFVPGTENLVISESIRRKFFAGEDPVGKIVTDVPAYGEKPVSYLITGVIKDIPGNTHLRAEALWITTARTEPLSKEQYGMFQSSYIMLKPGADVATFTKKVNNWYSKFVTVPDPYTFEFQPMKDIYLKSDFAQYQEIKGSVRNVYIFCGVALLLLLIACINFINLSTARSVTRLRETGVRKVLGASKGNIMLKFLSEAIVLFLIATIMAIFMYQPGIGYLEQYLGHELSQTFVSRANLLLIAIVVIAVITILTGVYPAWLMSGFKLANSLKGNPFTGKANGQNFLRKGLVVLQFSISIIVLLSLIVVHQQMKFMDKADIGFDKNNLMSIDYVSWDGKGKSVRSEIAALPGVESASISSWVPSTGAGYMSRDIEDPENPKNKITVWYIAGDIHLAKTLGLHLNSGRFLSPDFTADAMDEDSLRNADVEKYKILSELRPALITESTAKILKVKNLDAKINSVKSVPVGIVKDFHNKSFHDKLGATIILAEANPQYGAMLIRVKPGSEKAVNAAVKKLWRKFYPMKALEISWVDDMLTKQYEREARLKQLFTFFSILTMALASLGIFGLVVHAAQQRVKEIGVRKVLGASVTSIFQLLSAEFVKLVVIALLIASPVGWFLMNKWLQDFSYRVDIEWWVFLFAGLIAVLTALITVSFQSVKAAVANPVNSLRNE